MYITLPFKLKVFTTPTSYDINYALHYLERREKKLKEDLLYFQNLFRKYNIQITQGAVLDLAAGVGIDLKILSEFKPKKLIWHDKMEGPYEIAKKTLKDLQNVIFNKKDLMDLEEYRENSIDFIICRESLYYAGNDYYFFQQIKRILKPGGFFWGKNATKEYYSDTIKNKEKFLKKIQHVFDWNLYKFSGLRFFPFLPIEKRRLIFVLKKLNFTIIFMEEKEGFIEFLISKQ